MTWIPVEIAAIWLLISIVLTPIIGLYIEKRAGL